MKRSLSTVCLTALLTACSSLRYDLGDLPFPVAATPATGTAGEPFELVGKQVLWVHGLLGEKQPDVAAMLRAHVGDATSVSDFRVSAGASIWDWLGTHLSLGLVRLKTVTIRGRAVPN